jgi:hypothetical protein
MMVQSLILNVSHFPFSLPSNEARIDVPLTTRWTTLPLVADYLQTADELAATHFATIDTNKTSAAGLDEHIEQTRRLLEAIR